MQEPIQEKGFTLIELIVVLAGLGILSSLALPNVGRLLDFNNIDEAKALLNSTASDCLQKIRLNDQSARDTINPDIISDKRLKSLYYKINPDANKCSYFELTPTKSNDELRYPIGFAIVDGKLTKTGSPTSSDEASINSCENWAGENCKQDEQLKALVAYNKEIQAAKLTCETNYSNWLKSDGNGAVNRWNTAATKDCASRPPIVKSPTCTPNGCNSRVFALDGTVVGTTKEDYDKALEAKYGKICRENVQKLRDKTPPFTNPQEAPVTFTECGPQEFWFHKGTQTADETEWRGLMCTDEVNKNINEVLVTTLPYCGDKNHYFCDSKDQLSQDKWDNCVANNAEAKCLADREKARLNNYKGKYSGVAGPGRCGESVWMCDQKILSSEADYLETECGSLCQPRNKRRCDRTGLQRWCECI